MIILLIFGYNMCSSVVIRLHELHTWGCTGFDGGVEAAEASRSFPVCVKRGN